MWGSGGAARSGGGAMNPFRVTTRNTTIDVERYIDVNVIRIGIDRLI